MVSLSSRISPRTSTVIFRERSPRATAVVTWAMLRTWSVRLPHMAFTESVKSFQVPATPGTMAWPPSLPSVPTSRATRVTSEAKERSWSTMVFMASLSCRISPRTSTVIFLERSPLATAIVTSAMLRTWAVRLLAIELALGADFAGHARHLRGEHAELLDHGVDDGGRAQELALERPSVDVEAHRLQQIALANGGDGAGDFGRRPQEIVDQAVDRALHLAPGAAGEPEIDALPGLAVLADHLADALELLRHALVGGRDLVEGIGDLAGEPHLVPGHPHREIADAHRLQRAQKVVQGDIRAAVHGLRAVLFRRNHGRNGGVRCVGNGLTVRLHGFTPGGGVRRELAKSAKRGWAVRRQVQRTMPLRNSRHRPTARCRAGTPLSMGRGKARGRGRPCLERLQPFPRAQAIVPRIRAQAGIEPELVSGRRAPSPGSPSQSDLTAPGTGHISRPLALAMGECQRASNNALGPTQRVSRR